VKDSLTVMSRYMVSAMVSGFILMYELHNMRGFTNESYEDDVTELTHLTEQSGTIDHIRN